MITSLRLRSLLPSTRVVSAAATVSSSSSSPSSQYVNLLSNNNPITTNSVSTTQKEFSFSSSSPLSLASSSSSSCCYSSSSQLLLQRRFCSTSSTAEEEGGGGDTTTRSQAEQLDQLLEEVAMLLDESLPIGTLFKALSSESRSYISKQRMSFETFLLRYPQKFQVFKQTSGPDRNIYVCKAGMAPVNANHAQEVAGSTVAYGNNITNSQRARIYTVLKYIPNEWASYVMLPIPEDVKKQIIRKPAKNFFESNPRYFEVRFNPKQGHTFEVRRSEQLQQFMRQKAQMEAKNKQK